MAAAAAGLGVCGSSVAASERVVISVQGGDYARLLHNIIDVPLLQSRGIEVIQDIGSEPTRAAKFYAGRDLSHGVIDVSSNSAAVNYKLAQTGLLEALDRTKVPNLLHVLPQFHSNFIATQFYSPQVLVYNPAVVHAPPQSFTDLLDPRYHGKIGFPALSYFNVLLAASLLKTGSPDHIEQAKPLIEQLNNNGLRLYPQIDTVASAFASGEIVLGIMGMARVIMWQNAGINIAAAFPREGCIVYASGMVVPRNAPDKANAFRYLDAMLAPAAQRGFAAQMGYLPSIDNAQLAPKVARQLSLPTPRPELVEPDYAYTTRVQDQVGQWWNKLIQRG